MLVSVYDTLRSAGRELVLEPGARESLDARVSELRSGSELARGRREGHRPAACGGERGARPARDDPAARAAARARCVVGARASGRRVQRGADGRACARPGGAGRTRSRSSSRSCSRLRCRVCRRQGSRVGARLRGSAAPRPRPPPRERRRSGRRSSSASARSWSTSSRTRTACRPSCRPRSAPEPPKELFFVGDEFQSIYGFRHADVAVFRDRRDGGAAGAAADPQLPVAAGGARRRQRALRRRVRRHLPAARARCRVRRPGVRDAGRAARHRQGVVRGLRASTGVAPRRDTSPGASASSSMRGAATPGEIVLLFAAGTDAEWFEEELRALDLPTIRMTGRRYFGQQQVVDLLSYLRLLQNRYDDEALLTVLASPFVGVSNDALVLIRSTAERRPIFKGIERSLPSDLAEDDRRLVRAFLQRYERLVESSTRLLARAALRAHPRRARLRPRRSVAPRRPASLREPAKARAAGAVVRGASWPRHRGVHPLRRRAGGRGRPRARRRLGGGGRRRRAPADDPHRQGPRVQGGRRRGCGS